MNTDAVVGSTPTDDIEGQGINNYKYDEIGNLRKDSTEQIEFIEWNVYGKIKKIKRYLASTKSNLEFMYDASGNRIAKIEKPDGTSVENGAGADQPTNWKFTYYVRDAQGNVMGNYYQTNASHKLIEHPIYGSSRLGSDNTQLEMIAAVIPSPFTRTIGNKYFLIGNQELKKAVNDRIANIQKLIEKQGAELKGALQQTIERGTDVLQDKANSSVNGGSGSN